MTSSSLSIALPTIMQLEKIWFESFLAASHSQRTDDRRDAVRDASRRMLRAVKRRVTPQFAHSQREHKDQPVTPIQFHPVDADLRSAVAEAERAVQELSDAVSKQRTSVLAVVRDRAQKKMRLLYDVPVANLLAPAATTNVEKQSESLASEPLRVSVNESCAQLAQVFTDCSINAASVERKLSQLSTVLQHHMDPNAVEELLRAPSDADSANARKRKRAK